MTYLDKSGIQNAFAEHLIQHRGYSTEEAKIAVSDFPDPYRLPYLDEEYIDNVEIEGIEYEQCACYTSLWRCGIDGVPAFKFYTYYAANDIPNSTVQEYMDARKLYQIDGLDDLDFPV